MKKHLVAVLVVAMTALAACGSGGGGDDPTSGAPVKVTVANLAVTNSAGLVLGVKKGYFKAEGLDVTIKDTPAASTVPAVVSGDADFAFTGIPPLIAARSNKLPVKAVAAAAGYPTDLPNSQIQLVAPKASPITAIDQLEGKTVAVDTLFQLPHLSLIEALQSKGVDTSKITFKEVPYPSMLDALAKGTVDAADLGDPFLGIALKRGDRSLIPNGTGFSPGATQVIWVSSESYISKNAKVVAAFQRAVKKSNTYAQAHPDEVRAIVPSYMQVDKSVASSVLLPEYTESIDPAVFDVYEKLLTELKVVKSKVDVSDAIYQ